MADILKPLPTSNSLEEQDQQLEENSQSLMLFGTDVAAIPCFRNSMLYGLTSGFGGGIAHFAFSSKIINATRFGVYSFAGVTLSYWFYCRYNFAVARFNHRQIEHTMKVRQLLEGTPDDLSVLLKEELSVEENNSST